MTHINDEYILEALDDAVSSQRNPASLEEVLQHLCYVHPEVSAGLANSLQATLDFGVKHGYINQIDELYYVAPSSKLSHRADNMVVNYQNLYFHRNAGDSACNLANETVQNSENKSKEEMNSNPSSPSPSPSSSPLPSSSQGNEFKRRKQTRRKKTSVQTNLNRRVARGKGRRGSNRSSVQRRRPRRR